MERIQNFREKFVFILTTLLITIGLLCKDSFEQFVRSHAFEFNQNLFYLIVVATGSVLAEIGAKPMVEFILRSKRIRKLIAGSTFIEGYWYYTHNIKEKEQESVFTNPALADKTKDKEQKSVFTNPALAEMIYNPATQKLEMAVYRSGAGIKLFNSNSKTLKFDEKEKTYLNHFTYINHDVSSELDNGFAIGQYTSNDDHEIYRFQGTVYVTGNGGKRMIIFQEGEKIDDEVKQFKETYKGDKTRWREEFLKSRETEKVK